MHVDGQSHSGFILMYGLPYIFEADNSALASRTSTHSGILVQISCKEVDARIHFALVCGARSCPAIKTYDAANVEDALTEATMVSIVCVRDFSNVCP